MKKEYNIKNKNVNKLIVYLKKIKNEYTNRK